MEPDKTPLRRAFKFIKDLVAPALQPSRDRVLWTARIVLGLVVLLGILTLIGLPFGITLWAWVKLLIVPAVLAIGGYLFNSAQSRATQAAAEQHAQDEALQAYLDHMSDMLITNKDQPSLYKARPSDGLSKVARARTLTVLRRLNGARRARVLLFLYESGLINRDRPVLDLSGADLSGVDLSGVDLTGVDLFRANLPEVNLSGTNLFRTHLWFANLSGANLSGANLLRADFRGAELPVGDLSGSNLSGADLSAANLEGAVLSFANLSGANLFGTNLMDANLSDARGWPEDQSNRASEAQSREGSKASEARSLKGATMPNGQKYEDWLKSKNREEEG